LGGLDRQLLHDFLDLTNADLDRLFLGKRNLELKEVPNSSTLSR
jgi:hypothetical protein